MAGKETPVKMSLKREVVFITLDSHFKLDCELGTNFLEVKGGMNEDTTNKRVGRPPTGKKTSKPNISILKTLMDDVTECAKHRNMGLSDFFTMALNRQIAVDQAKRESSEYPIKKRREAS